MKINLYQMKIGHKIKTIAVCLSVFLTTPNITKAFPLNNPSKSIDKSFLFFKKKDKNSQKKSIDETNALNDTSKVGYSKLIEDASSVTDGLFRVIKKGGDYYFEIPKRLMNHDMLVVNKLVRVPLELNEAGINRGINYENQMIRFELSNDADKVYIRQSRPLPFVPENASIAQSVRDNYISPLIHSFKVETENDDSTAVVVKVNDIYNGTQTSINNVFNNINLGTSANKDLSQIISVKSFENNIYVTSELTTKVTEANTSVYVTVEVGSTILLLPEKPMKRRLMSNKVGYFTESALSYSDDQQRVSRDNFITRWRLEPKEEDVERYLKGEVVEPIKPIVFYIDNTTPQQWRPYIKKGIEDWQDAFEKAGFKNAIIAKEITDSMAVDMDDMSYSVLTYAASTKANAMGPSITDPRSGEILEADIIWWHNVLDILNDWIVVQTGTTRLDANKAKLPDELIGDAMRFVACHEVGHSLGLRHNMMASSTIPTDSLRSVSYTNKLNSTSSSIMDYARFNYVAQPGDGIKVFSPNIGPYDMMAIEYGYRWYGKDDPKEDYVLLQKFLSKYTHRLFRYSEAQDAREAVDPRSQNEDLGDDPVKSSQYGIANLKRIVPNIVEWTTTGEVGQTYEDASRLYYSVMGQWNRYMYHVMANIGGIYIENVSVGDNLNSYEFVDKKRQRKALEFLIKEAFIDNDWLFDAEVGKYTYIKVNTPNGPIEYAPSLMRNNMQSYLFWDLLSNHRLMRMLENESVNKKNAFTVVELMDMLHNGIFGVTERGAVPDVKTRILQKNFVDALLTAAAESEGVKINKGLTDVCNLLNDFSYECNHCRGFNSENNMRRELSFYGSQANRISDAISVKRGEIMRLRSLLKNRRTTKDTATRYHYEDLIMRINTALGLEK